VAGRAGAAGQRLPWRRGSGGELREKTSPGGGVGKS
jgi:hypothetical protein